VDVFVADVIAMPTAAASSTIATVTIVLFFICGSSRQVLRDPDLVTGPEGEDEARGQGPASFPAPRPRLYGKGPT
jgi:hypothetical protein